MRRVRIIVVLMSSLITFTGCSSAAPRELPPATVSVSTATTESAAITVPTTIAVPPTVFTPPGPCVSTPVETAEACQLDRDRSEFEREQMEMYEYAPDEPAPDQFDEGPDYDYDPGYDVYEPEPDFGY